MSHLQCSPVARSLLLSGWTTTVAAASAALLLVLGGCASPGPDTQPHALMTAPSSSSASSSADATPWPGARWWDGFGDARLGALIDQAIAAEPSLQSTQARIRLAQAALDAAGATTKPQVAGSADTTRQRYTENGLVPKPLAGSWVWNANAQIGASWELDLFGRHRAELDAAIGQLRAAQADRQAAHVLTAASTAQTYFTLARLLETRSVAETALLQRRQVLELVRQRVAAGLDTTVDLRQAEGLIAQSEVEIEALAEQIARTRHALAEITGQTPQALLTLAPRLATVSSTALPQTLPADLLGRRADLVAQRWRVEAATKNVDLARTQFYPNINLTAFIGLQSLSLDKFVEAGSRTYGAGPAIRLPIFEGGRLRANLDARRAEVDAAVDAYNATLLRALREVADEMSSLKSLEQQQRAQAQATAAAEAAFDLAVQRYRAGLGNFLTVLTAQTTVLAQQRAATELKARHLISEVNLSRALGGGYTAAPELLPAQLAATSATNPK